MAGMKRSRDMTELRASATDQAGPTTKKGQSCSARPARIWADRAVVHPFFQPGANTSTLSVGQVLPSPPTLYHYVAHDPLLPPPQHEAGPFRLAVTQNGQDGAATTHTTRTEDIAPATTSSARKVAVSFYDLDGTLIKPRSGAKWPKDREDWAWWHVSVPAKLKKEVEEGRHIVVISNQGSEQPKRVAEWKAKVPLIAAKVSPAVQSSQWDSSADHQLPNVPIRVLAAFSRTDIYRKPNIGMFQAVEQVYRDAGYAIDMEQSFYVGDAAGRVGFRKGEVRDHADTDYKWALNVGLPFLTPEVRIFSQIGRAVGRYTNVAGTLSQSSPSPIPRTTERIHPRPLGQPGRPYVSSSCNSSPHYALAALLQTSAGRPIILAVCLHRVAVPPIVPSNTPITSPTPAPEIVLFIGPPASGKTSFFRHQFLPAGYTHINQDILRTRDNCLAAAERAVAKGERIVVDNTNRNRQTRRYWIDLAERLHVPIRVFHFLCPVELARHNNMYRAVYAPPGEAARDLLPQIAFTSYASAFEKPDINEGFDELRLVNFKWEGTDAQRRLWDMYMLETR